MQLALEQKIFANRKSDSREQLTLKFTLFLSFQVIRLLEQELDSYKAKEAEQKPDIVSIQFPHRCTVC